MLCKLLTVGGWLLVDKELTKFPHNWPPIWGGSFIKVSLIKLSFCVGVKFDAFIIGSKLQSVLNGINFLILKKSLNTHKKNMYYNKLMHKRVNTGQLKHLYCYLRTIFPNTVNKHLLVVAAWTSSYQESYQTS